MVHRLKEEENEASPRCVSALNFLYTVDRLNWINNASAVYESSLSTDGEETNTKLENQRRMRDQRWTNVTTVQINIHELTAIACFSPLW